MNITFMIGNGFDINLGLSTRYTDFIKVYRNIQEQDNAVIKKFKAEIIESDLPLWSNAELAFGKQTSLLNKSFNVSDYCSCHSHFCRSLANYLREEQKKLVISKDNNSVIANKFSKAVNNLKLGFREVPREAVEVLFSRYGGLVFNFIDFNYTNTIDRLCLETNRLVNWGMHNGNSNALGRFIHVHGTIDKDMILGVNDETQIANLDIFKSVDEYYLAQMIKSQTDSVNEEYTYEKAIQILNSSHFVYVYGMSLGDTDKFWWKQLCELLLKKAEVQVVIHCYDAPKDELFRFDVKRFENAQKLKLLNLGDVSEEQRKNLVSRIHITGANIFDELENIAVQNDKQAKAS